MHYSIIMDDGYGDIRIFLLSDYNEKIQKSLKNLFDRHTLLAVVPSSGGYIDREGGWSMDKEYLIDQIHLSEYNYDEEEDWQRYKTEMTNFIEKYLIE